MDLMRKLAILADSAKYDAACTSSGVDRKGTPGGIGNACASGICHTFTADGRCVSLLKVLMSNSCVYDCMYCVNRAGNDVPRAAFTPRELSELTIEFYRRNYIEGLFLSSGVVKSPDHTMDLMIGALSQLRYAHRFGGYIHAKAIPGASSESIRRLGLLADRMSVNIELPSERSLSELAPGKSKQAILTPMRQIAEACVESSSELALYRGAPRFVPAGQATQMIIGATPDSDFQIIRLASGLYKQYGMKRVFYSAYIPVSDNKLLPTPLTPPPLLREHRLYQADFLLRQYRFAADEILSAEAPNLNPYMDPKCNWAVQNLDIFPVDVNTAPLETLLRIPGIGPKSAKRILSARREAYLSLHDLKRIGAVIRRAQYFIRTRDLPRGIRLSPERTIRALVDPNMLSYGTEQVSLLDPAARDGISPAIEEAVRCLAKNL